MTPLIHTAQAGSTFPLWLHGAALHWSARLLVATTWIAGAVFAAYIVVFFGGVALGGDGERWNESLPGLYDARVPAATVAIGAHFVAGSVLLLLGPIQLIGRLRRSVPALHRGLGRVYVVAAGLAGLGGLAFILAKGTVGGTVMDAGFGLYGALMVLCAAMAFVHARAGRYERHRAWAIRLFALVVGSWLYRMEYGTWFLVSGGLGTGRGFSGWFDMVMAFFFYVPNLIVAEQFIRARRKQRGALLELGSAALLLAASAFVMMVTWTFTEGAWGRRMAGALVQASL
ncbi:MULTISPECIES: DUF2306 domain-containing protein [Hydrocarboniphaga]|jgi:hypothetical protein|uniref:DUF2306 domain-containing protein n=2 Tax=Gammaproteobacteria TaxID=1236 RepID=I8TE29_9GAMM|nr:MULTISPECIES: DUF2306 domain-containing protein [Hydrocarboniphaga]EIT72240.1 hypothetical protein WQQ_23770 [Hydrocarboniphaga effusa AP103]MDZ4079627.1 DUF2306 domain-containing protein [Hydrocarboniphaga sp.]